MVRGNKEETETKKPADSMSQRALEFVAEKEGFEPSIPFDIHTFQACAFDHSATSPQYLAKQR